MFTKKTITLVLLLVFLPEVCQAQLFGRRRAGRQRSGSNVQTLPRSTPPASQIRTTTSNQQCYRDANGNTVCRQRTKQTKQTHQYAKPDTFEMSSMREAKAFLEFAEASYNKTVKNERYKAMQKDVAIRAERELATLAYEKEFAAMVEAHEKRLAKLKATHAEIKATTKIQTLSETEAAETAAAAMKAIEIPPAPVPQIGGDPAAED